MKFYKENEVNPFGSCLPLVAQLPVFISLFYMLREDLRNDICPALSSTGYAQTTARCTRAAHTVRLRASQRRELPVHPGPHQQGDRRGAGGPDRALRRDPARLEPDDVEPDDGPHAAADDAVPAAGLRHLRHQLPGRAARVLDHHQPVDDRPAVHGQADDRRLRPPAGDRRRGRRGGGSCRAGGARLGRRRPAEVRPQRVGRIGGGSAGLDPGRPKEPRRREEPVATAARGRRRPRRRARRRNARAGGGSETMASAQTTAADARRELLERIVDASGSTHGRGP